MYSPSIGRFLQRDPAGYAPGPNEYQFTGSNPIVRLDPIGLFDGPIWYPDSKGNPVDLIAQREAARKEMLAAWAAAQKARLDAAFVSLVPVGNYKCPTGANCTPAQAKAQAQEIADAIVNAVLQRRETAGDQTGGYFGNLGKEHGCDNFECGDWQQLVINAIATMRGRHLKDGFCFKETDYRAQVKNPDYWHIGTWKHGTPFHNWVGLSTVGGGPEIVIDPWPSGGKGDLDDPSDTTGWPIVNPF